MLHQSLHQGWRFSAISDLSHVPEALRQPLRDGVDATVPGCVHLDLLRADLMPDPYMGLNEREVQWVGETAWTYSAAFDVTADLLHHEHVNLVCEGLDTVATVEINGQVVGQSLSQHVTWRYDVKRALRAGGNRIVIRFASPLAYSREMEARLGPQPRSGHGSNIPHPMQFIRKMACNFGWDWGPILITAGIWKPIRLEAWNRSRIEAVRPHVMLATDQRAVLDVVLQTHHAPGGPASAIIRLLDPDDQLVVEREMSGSGRLRLDIDNPRLWWPRGHGAQPLYRLEVTLADTDGTTLDHWSKRIGLRTTELITDPDERGSRFGLRINGRVVYAKGANWVPDDCFLPRVDERRYRDRLQQACDMNMNILRVWGGGIFEVDAFYDLCDEMGLMVWQDFLFACGCYPEEEPFLSLVEREARDNINRLCSHPSLVLWNGCNENLMLFGDPAKRAEPHKPWGLRYYFDLLPRVLSEMDPSRPFWPASPYSGTVQRSVFDHSHGNCHIWSVWFGGHWQNYRKHATRFCSEFGWQAPATWATMKRAMDSADFGLTAEGQVHRQRSPRGETINLEHVQNTYNIDGATAYEDMHYLLQLNQARALAAGVTWFRSRYPVNLGTVYWQINDCWPVTSWAAIDGDGRFKPLYYATRRFYQPRLATIQPVGLLGQEREKDLAVYLHNDSGQPWQASVVAELRNMNSTSSRVLATQNVEVAPWSLQRVELPTDLDRSGAQFVVASVAGERSFWFFADDRELPYPVPQFDATLEGSPGQWRLKLHARTLLRDLCVFVDRLDSDAVIDDQVLTLLPGDDVTLRIQSAKTLDVDSLTAAPVLQCANRFGRQQG